MNRLSDYDYVLPPELVASAPPAVRGASRMLVLDRATGACETRLFSDLPAYLDRGDCLALNTTRVIKARLNTVKNGDGARIELLLVAQMDSPRRWSCLMKHAKRTSPGTRLKLTPPPLSTPDEWVTVLERLPDGLSEVEFDSPTPFAVIDRFGHIPLPPYIKRPDTPSDADRYQTVYSKTPGAVAAPTAGLHFDQAMITTLRQKGVNLAELTLHVGPGTFQPVKVESLDEHRMHTEWFDLPAAAAEQLNATRRKGGRVCAIGTTALRVLESRFGVDGTLQAGSGWTDIFIRPPQVPKAADMLLTNFHLPKSTLLMLVCAFAGTAHIKAAYDLAIRERFRFYSYGDCMLIRGTLPAHDDARPRRGNMKHSEELGI